MSGNYIEYFNEDGELITECMEENEMDKPEQELTLGELQIIGNLYPSMVAELRHLIAIDAIRPDMSVFDLISFLQRS